MQHDIAILEVGSMTQAELASTGAHPICLPSTDYHGGEAAVVSGWGSTKEGKYVEEKYSRISLSLSPRGSRKYFEISAPRHIRFAELREKIE